MCVYESVFAIYFLEHVDDLQMLVTSISIARDEGGERRASK